MKLTARVVTTHSASEFTDNQPRVTVKVAEADSMDSKLKLRNTSGLALDDELVVVVMRQGDAALVYDSLSREDRLTDSLKSLRDQLRPDPPVPFLINDADAYQQRYEAMRQPDTASTQEFRRGGAV